MDSIISYPQLGEKYQNVAVKHSKKARYIRISIDSIPQVKITVPKRANVVQAKKFFESRMGWVKTQLEKIERNHSLTLATRRKLSAEEFLARTHYLILRCKNLAEKYNFKVRKISLRRQRTIWGSCSGQNDISLNANLVFLSDELIDYVITHELVHTKIKDHSPRFWRMLESIMPAALMLDKKLGNYRPKFYLK
jgi:predicted metal-dependent hydrolase